MFMGNAEAVAREQHKDNLRRVEKANLVRQLERNNNQFSVWQTVINWLKPVAAKQQVAIFREANLAKK